MTITYTPINTNLSSADVLHRHDKVAPAVVADAIISMTEASIEMMLDTQLTGAGQAPDSRGAILTQLNSTLRGMTREMLENVLEDLKLTVLEQFDKTNFMFVIRKIEFKNTVVDDIDVEIVMDTLK